MGLFNFKFQKREEPQEPDKKKQDGAKAKVRANAVSIGEANAGTVASFSHAIDLRAKTFARGMLELQMRTPDGVWQKCGGDEVKKLHYMLQVRPNIYQSAAQMWEMASRIADLSHEGLCGIWAPGLSRGTIRGLTPCTAEWLETTNTYVLNNVKMNVNSIEVKAEDVILVSNGYGCSLIALLKRTLELAATADQFNRDTLAKGGTFKAIVKQETSGSVLQGMDALDDEEVEANFDEINRQFREGNDFIYDPSAAQITQISQSFQDLQLPNTKDGCIGDIARVCGVPLPLMFLSTNAVYKSIDDAWHTFKELTMQPKWDALEQELNGKYLNYLDYDKFRFHVLSSSICLDSDKNRADRLSVLVEAGVITPNEARKTLNLGKAAGGDQLKEPKSNTTPSDGEKGGEK